MTNMNRTDGQSCQVKKKNSVQGKILKLMVVIYHRVPYLNFWMMYLRVLKAVDEPSVELNGER